MERVFIDCDICLDLLSERKPHYEHAALLFTLADKGKINIYVSSLTFSSLHHLLSRQFSAKDARRVLSKFKILVNVVPIDDKIIELALSSDFSDFEDAIQYFAAIESNIDILLTRNLRDYRKAKISIMTVEDFLPTLS